MRHHRFVLAAVALAWLAPAQAQQPAAGVAPAAGIAPAAAPVIPPAAAIAPGAAVQTPDGSPATSAQILRGNDQVFAPPKPGAMPQGTASSFRFEDAPISDVVHVIMRDVLRVDYVVHSQLVGNITLATRGDVPADQAVYLLESALQANGIGMARDTRGVYHIGKPEALAGIVASPRLAAGGVLPPGTGTVIVPLQFIGANEMAAILRPILPPNALVRVDPLRNLLVLAGSRTQAEGWLDIVNTFDVSLLRGMSVAIVPLRYASVRDLEAALRSISTGVAPPAPTTGAQQQRPGAAPPGAAGQAPPGGPLSIDGTNLFGAVRVLPIERMNSLLLVSPRAAYLDEARAWIDRLDRPGVNAAEPQLYIYPVKNGSARHLAEVLNALFGNESRSTTTTASGVAPTLSSSTASTAGAGQINSLSPSTGTSSSQSRITAVGTTPQGARVAADELNNAVLIYAVASEYGKIEAALRRLDVSAVQVLIEASIVEVTLNDDLQYGLQWYFTDKARSGLSGTGVISQVGGGVAGFTENVVAAATAGFSYTLKNALGNVQAVLSALADKSLVKVISSPSVMVLDNHTAGISVGQQTPVRSAQVQGTGNFVTETITYKDTGVNLQVTPSVSAENVVTMAINQQVTDVGPPDGPSGGQRSFLQRQIISKVAVRSGETLVLGGLIRDNQASGNRGVPLLSDIPVVGSLFGTQSKLGTRTELLVVITPRVVRSDLDARDVGQELRDRMRSFPAHDMLRRP